MKYGLLFLGLRESLALDRDTMQQFRARDSLEIFKHTGKMQHVMAVNRSEIPEIQRFEQITLFKHRTLDTAFYLCCQGPGPCAYLLVSAQQSPYLILEPVIGLAGGYVKEIFLQGSDAGVNGDIVIIEYHQQVSLLVAGVVETFKSEPCLQGAVAYHCHHFPFFPFGLCCHSHTQCC